MSGSAINLAATPQAVNWRKLAPYTIKRDIANRVEKEPRTSRMTEFQTLLSQGYMSQRLAFSAFSDNIGKSACSVGLQ